MIRVLLIGPLPPPMGGDTRHFATLVEDLRAHNGFNVTLVNTSRGAEHSSLTRNFSMAVRTLRAVIANRRTTDVVSFHASDRGMFLFGPLIVGMCRLLGKPTILRLFGGSFGDFYEAGGGFRKAVIRRFILSADVVLLQTKRSIAQLPKGGAGRLVWFSTYIKRVTRPLSDAADDHSRHDAACSRFVFLGHLWRTKGLEIILSTASQLPDGCTLDIYGPLDEYTAETIAQRGLGRVRYRGFLTHDQVSPTLWKYDCLVLPTFHPGEGYPGVIAEAFANDLPVITTRWLAIPEIVDDSCGILIQPDDPAAFVAAVTRLHRDREGWLRMKEGARARAAQFDHAVWSGKFEALCEELVRS